MSQLAKKLKFYRKKANYTQEALAGFFHVSFQTISKWERGESYPDIHMLPVIARFFDISVDELLGVDEDRDQKRRQQLLEDWKTDNSYGNNMENVARMREALKLYPGDFEIMQKLVNSLEKCTGTPDEEMRYKKEAAELSKKIIQFCPDKRLVNEMLHNLCYTYWSMGEIQQAQEHAKQLAPLRKAQENALVTFLQGEERLMMGQDAAITLASLLYHHISSICKAEYYSLKEREQLLIKYLQICEILFEEGDVVEVLHCMADAYVKLVAVYKEMGEEQRRGECVGRIEELLKKSAKCEQGGRPKSLLARETLSKGVLTTLYKEKLIWEALEGMNEKMF